MEVWVIITSVVSACSTYFVAHELNQGGIRASAGLSFIVGLVSYLSPGFVPAAMAEHLPVVFIGASFVGMSNKHVLPGYLDVALAGIIFGSLFLMSGVFFNGYGGGLGTVACIAVVAVHGLRIYQKIRTAKRPD